VISVEPANSIGYFDPTAPAWPTSSGLFGGFSQAPACPSQAPSGGRSPQSTTSVGGYLCRTAAVFPESQLITSYQSASAETVLSGPADSIFEPPRNSV
jgi:hypothetical protein